MKIKNHWCKREEIPIISRPLLALEISDEYFGISEQF